MKSARQNLHHYLDLYLAWTVLWMIIIIGTAISNPLHGLAAAVVWFATSSAGCALAIRHAIKTPTNDSGPVSKLTPAR